jgi:hypothetical protein
MVGNPTDGGRDEVPVSSADLALDRLQHFRKNARI